MRIIGENSAPKLSIEYNSADYSENLIAGLAESFNIVLKQFIEQNNQLVRKISLLDDNRAKILAKFRSNTDPTTIKKLYHYFHEVFEEKAIKNPEKVALIAADFSLTYKELDEGANKIANALIECGIKPKSRVALLLPRTSRAILAIFGVLKAGCAYIPCDTEYPAERINQIIDDSNSAYIITTSERISSKKSLDVEKLLENPNSTRPNIEISPDDLAYLIYTSGSTGKPKGVMIKHSGAANYFTDNPANLMVHALCNDCTKFISVTTFAFDMSLKEIGTTLFNGLTLVLADEIQANNPDKLAELARKTSADALNATPSRFLSYLESEFFAQTLKNFKLVVSGGEKYSKSLLDKLKSITSARIFNTYGPTEITISSNAKELTNSNEISIGRPLFNVTEFIVDSDENELPPGIVGELYIGGAGVGKGYNNLPEKTAERFIDFNGMKIYKSGDYARWTSSGDVEILGRLDNQIKLRGLRIEIGEIEGSLAKIPEIKSSVVKIVKIKGIEHLCAYFTAENLIDIETLKAELGKTLPKYMVPTAYLQMEKMPMTLNGKIDLKSLPEATIFRTGTTSKAANKIEEDFCKIFSSILQIEDVGADESFFDLGGTSLLVTRVVIMAQKLGYKVNFADVFLNRTPRELAALVKHFETGNEIENVNVGGVKNLIEICKAQNLRLIQVSTMSTVRSGIKGEVDENATPSEKTIYFRQSLTNKYVRSKFLAERAILDAISDGLNAKIMRVGNLSARYSDGEFQINAGTNSSMGRLKIFAIIGQCPFAQMDNLIEFSPIDEVAKTILLLSETPKQCAIFHPINHHNMAIGDVVSVMQSCGLDINFVEQEDFQKAWQTAEDDPDKSKILTSSIAYRSGNKDSDVITFPKNNLYTMQVLYRLGYRWPLTTWQYVEKFINLLQRLGFFNVQ